MFRTASSERQLALLQNRKTFFAENSVQTIFTRVKLFVQIALITGKLVVHGPFHSKLGIVKFVGF
jgi:hypothetical protein